MENQKKFVSLRWKLLIAFFAVAIVPLIILGIVAFATASRALTSDAILSLEAIRQIKSEQVESFFHGTEAQIITFSENPVVVEAMRDFSNAAVTIKQADLAPEELEQQRRSITAFYQQAYAPAYEQRNDMAAPVDQFLFDVDPFSTQLQYRYIVENPFNIGEKANFDQEAELAAPVSDEAPATEEATATTEGETPAEPALPIGPTYGEIHAQIQPIFRSYAEKFGYDDVYLVDSRTGVIVYSVAKEIDFATSLHDGPFASTAFGKAFRLANAGTTTDVVEMADYEPYAPIFQEPASFIASPIFDGEEKIGVLVFRLSLNSISKIMQEQAGLGQTGETYLIGPDKLWRTDSRFLDNLGVSSTILNVATIADTESAQAALDGQAGTKVTTNYRNNAVLSSWAPVQIQAPTQANPDGLTWAIIAEVDQTEVQQPVLTMALIVGGLALLAIVVVVVVAVLFTRGVNEQVSNIAQVLTSVEQGDYAARAETNSNDELGLVASGLNSMLDNTVQLIQTSEERDTMQFSIMKLLEEVSVVAEGDLTVEAEVTADMTGAIADSFNFMIEQLRNIIFDVQEATLQVSSSANEVQATTEYLAQGSETQAAQILDTSAAIDEMTVSIQQVSESAVMSAEVGQQATNSAKRGSQAVQATVQGMDRIREQVEETAKRITRLGRSSEEIGKIVQLIGDIADRTSILALNASIQAAAAGDAGRGFAVVAEEVERLAERSTEATRQIATLTRTIQSETQEAVASMRAATTEVVTGTKLAQEAGDTLQEIQNVSDRLAELIQSISLAAKQQARGSETIAHAMNDIADVTQQTAAGTKQAAVSISSLAMLADNLRNSVSAFKLPMYENGHEEQLTSAYNGGHAVLPHNEMEADELLYDEQDIMEISDYADISKLS